MKVIMVSNEFPPSIGGVQTHVYELSKAMVRLGHQVAVVTRLSDSALAIQEVMDGVAVFRVKLSNNHMLYDFKLHRLLQKMIDKEGYQAVHIHGMRPLKACKKLSVPVVFTNHTSSFLKRVTKGPKVLHKMKKQLDIAQQIFAPSDELVEATKKTGYQGPTSFISNGVDINRFYPVKSELRKELGIPESAFVAVLARRLVEKNGVLYFAKAIVKANQPDLHVIVAGDGADRSAFEKIITEGGCTDKVHFLGGVDNQKMPEVFSAGDVSVLPSLMEATSIAGLEAMACGLPLIGTNVGGIPVIIQDGETGILVEPKSPEQLADALVSLCNNRPLVTRLGENSLNSAKHDFSWDVIAEKTIRLTFNSAT
ncbi:glycosyltransferase family 4 protein [Litoribacillus peritrichatus]|uniref:Glycosyltransferase family 4 protein n=1 Tax=Litoribacillus peritrichatus TaxID=718191 RepID=A0ABP7MMQ9_9GAMM